jgi:DNA-directed RNA polymerase alpha subunit
MNDYDAKMFVKLLKSKKTSTKTFSECIIWGLISVRDNSFSFIDSEIVDLIKKKIREHFPNINFDLPIPASIEKETQIPKKNVTLEYLKENGLRPKAFSLLKSLHVENLQQITTISPKDLLKYRNFGPKSLEKLKSLLSEFGLSLKEDDNDE